MKKKKLIILTKLQQEVRGKLISYALTTFKLDYHLSNEDIADIFGISKQAVQKHDKNGKGGGNNGNP